MDKTTTALPKPKLGKVVFNRNNITLALVAVGFVIVTQIFKISILCPFYRLTGLHCPGCGITRMFLSIWQLNFYQAFRCNPLVFVLLPEAIFLWLEHLLSLIRGRTSIYQKLPQKFWIALVVLMILYGVLRNLGPFSYLAPAEF